MYKTPKPKFETDFIDKLKIRSLTRTDFFIYRCMIRFLNIRSVFLVTDVSCFSRIEYEVADGSNESIDTASDVAENEISESSGGVTFRLQGSVVDDKASDPTKEKCEKEANEFIVIHDKSPLKIK